jgi:hypothetical protein
MIGMLVGNAHPTALEFVVSDASASGTLRAYYKTSLSQ